MAKLPAGEKDIAEFSEELEAATGFEPMNSDFADRCLTTWLRRHPNGAGNGIRTRDINLGKVALYR
jgi:hypothetical protein